MKKLLIIVGVLVAFNIVSAQEPTRKERIQSEIEAYKERLQLSDVQVAQLKEMHKKYRPEMKAIRDDESKSRSDKMRAAADIMEKKEDEIATILSNEQMAEWNVIRKEISSKRIARRENRRKGRDGN